MKTAPLALGRRFFDPTQPITVQYFGRNADFILKNHIFVQTYWNLKYLR